MSEAAAASTNSLVGRTSITTRMIFMGVIVATVVAIVAAIAAFPLIRGTAETNARADLARLADVTAATVQQNPGGRFVVPPQVAASLQAQNVDAYVVFSTSAELPPGVTAAEVAEVTSGESVSAISDSPEVDVLVEGRPLRPGTGIFVIQPTSIAAAPTQSVFLRFGGALLLGIAVAIVVAVLVAQRVTQPLRRAAKAADLLGRGDRDVQLVPEGPTEVARILESLNQLNTALANSEGRQREFLLSVSHELRTPLTAVRGYAEALADGLVVQEDLPRIAELVVTETQRLERLVADLLDLARLRAVDFQVAQVPCDMTGVVAEAQAHWQERCRRVGVQLTVEVEPELVALADPIRLRQILDNLTENALRVTDEGGIIRWRIVRQPASQTTSIQPMIVVAVADSGPGLSADDARVAFEPGVLYERFRGVRKVGTGLGLAIVGRLAEGMSGTAVAVASDLGGAQFEVHLPAVIMPPSTWASA